MATGTAVDVVMPQMGVSVSEGTITRWLKNVGDTVEADEPLLEISTDKVDTEVPSPGTGVVSEILVQEGETVDVGTVLARIGGDGAAPAAAPQPEPPPEPAARAGDAGSRDAAAASADGGVREAPEQEQPLAPPTEPAAAPHAGNGHAGDEHRFVSPVVARIAAEHGIDPAQVEGTGRGGRVTKKDILAYVESGAARSSRGPPSSAPAAPTPAAPPPAAPPRAGPPQPPQPVAAAALRASSAPASRSSR